MAQNLNIVIAGIGTVGSSTIRLIEKNKNIFLRKSGLKINILGIFAKNKFKTRNFTKNKYKWFDNPIKMIKQENVDIVLELIGGDKGIAKEICYLALKNKKNLITANKALIANEGYKLAKLAEKNEVKIGFDSQSIELVAMSDAKPLYSEIMPRLEAGNRRAEIFIQY